MHADDVRNIVKQVLDEESSRHEARADDIAIKTMATMLTAFGIEEDDKKEIRADFVHLRKWRKSVEQAQSFTFKVVVVTIISGFLGACWLGFKAMLGK